MSNETRVEQLGKELEKLNKSFCDLPAYELAVHLLVQGTHLMLCSAPDELTGIKAIIAAIDIGISQYQEKHS